MILSLLGLAVAPGIAVALYVYFRDRYEKEPLALLVTVFIGGFFFVVPAALIEMSLDHFWLLNDSVFHTAIKNFLCVGFTEEFLKFICLYILAYPKKDFNEPFDGITYAVMVSMGFATSENIVYVMNGGMPIAIVRIFTAVPAHASFAVLMGYFVGLAKFNNHKKSHLVLGIMTATLFHGSYDFFLSIENIEFLALGALASLVIGLGLSFKAMKSLSENSPFRYSALRRKPI
ncbi:MAG: PrsW family glutamic-type intramembrane protease [Bacteroidota bacterium]|nr:PrsW family glutamic-type intramembrane protease [Bacteroidota bacterium]